MSALTPIEHGKAHKNEVQPALMNGDLLSREADSISLLLSLLVRVLYLNRNLTAQVPRVVFALFVLFCNFVGY